MPNDFLNKDKNLRALGKTVALVFLIVAGVVLALLAAVRFL